MVGVMVALSFSCREGKGAGSASAAVATAVAMVSPALPVTDAGGLDHVGRRDSRPAAGALIGPIPLRIVASVV